VPLGVEVYFRSAPSKPGNYLKDLRNFSFEFIICGCQLRKIKVFFPQNI
jgi:hypothetical protein